MFNTHNFYQASESATCSARFCSHWGQAKSSPPLSFMANQNVVQVLGLVKKLNV
jgi:hypothetical protein